MKRQADTNDGSKCSRHKLERRMQVISIVAAWIGHSAAPQSKVISCVLPGSTQHTLVCWISLQMPPGQGS